MTKKNKNQDIKKENIKEQAENESLEGGVTTKEEASSGEGSSSDSQDDLDKLKQEVSVLNDKYLRLYSEFENYRKRSSREKLDLMKNASEDMVISLLPVLDDFDRAIKTLEERTQEDPVAEGVKLIHNKLYNILTQKGLQAADAMEKDFDTDYHEAITSVPAPSDDMKGKVVDVTEKGYLLNGKVIRFAKVVVGA